MEDDIVVIVLSNVILNRQSENVAWEIASMLVDSEYQPQFIPKNTYELVFDFIRTRSPDKANQLPQFIKAQTGTSLNDKAVLNRIGIKQVSQKTNTNWGLALLKLNVNLFAEDGNLWDSLGEAYYLLNDKDNAIESFKKALELKSETNCHWCENATNRLQELLSN